MLIVHGHDANPPAEVTQDRKKCVATQISWKKLFCRALSAQAHEDTTLLAFPRRECVQQAPRSLDGCFGKQGVVRRALGRRRELDDILTSSPPVLHYLRRLLLPTTKLLHYVSCASSCSTSTLLLCCTMQLPFYSLHLLRARPHSLLTPHSLVAQKELVPRRAPCQHLSGLFQLARIVCRRTCIQRCGIHASLIACEI